MLDFSKSSFLAILINVIEIGRNDCTDQSSRAGVCVEVEAELSTYFSLRTVVHVNFARTPVGS